MQKKQMKKLFEINMKNNKLKNIIELRRRRRSKERKIKQKQKKQQIYRLSFISFY